MGERRPGPWAGECRTPSERRRARRVDDEQALIAAGLLPGVDFCPHALELSGRGRLTSASHRAECAVCVRRWRVEEAGLQPWRPMRHDRAVGMLADMAAVFTSESRSGSYRPFYAHVARCADCERRLAELTFDQVLTAPEGERKPTAVRQ